MTRPTALLVDDEAGLLASLRRALGARWPELQVVGEAQDGATALEVFEELRPDVVFLDVQMPGLGGLEVARALGGRCHVVFVTAHEQYAIQAFEHAAVDYLLKPVDEERLATSVARLRSRLASPPADVAAAVDALARRLEAAAPRFLEWLQVQVRQDLVLVAVDDVDLFQSSDKYTLALAGDDEWVIRTPLKELEASLDPARFWRVHRNAIVRVGAIARVSRDASGQPVVHLRRGARSVPVSRAWAHRFKQM
ncbi:MAG TPA: LytTR family DNA-binding domain-containing protein [Anaeromyxobacter sp.]|nr:LytTR family DNA-binding domain-containing protein [Anaeromyxobacter sp.]